MNISEILEIIDPGLNFLMPYLQTVWEVFKKWYWVFLPFFLWRHFLYYWLWWRQELWDNKQKFIVIEVKISKENPKPIRAMEAVFSGLWQIYTPPSPIEKWWDGQQLLAYSFEIAAIDGVPHFFIRLHNSALNMVESHIYSQFPDAEISVVEDYTKKVPQDIPNEEWDIWCADSRLIKSDPYPIKTYKDFETEREFTEEKKIDPMASLFEGMTKLKKGEQFWLQIRAKPVGEEGPPWKKQAKETVNSLVNRDSPPKKKFFLWEMLEIVVSGAPEKKEKPKDSLPPEMKLTPGEKEIVAGIERKMGKLAYEVVVRYAYVGKKDVFFKPNLKIAMSYFTNFISDNSNGIIPDGPTITKTRKKWYDPLWFPKRRLYLKKRRSFRRCVTRLPYYFPEAGGTFILNIEELATIYHFPSKVITPASLLPRTDAKKAEAPINLPTEDTDRDE